MISFELGNGYSKVVPCDWEPEAFTKGIVVLEWLKWTAAQYSKIW